MKTGITTVSAFSISFVILASGCHTPGMDRRQDRREDRRDRREDRRDDRQDRREERRGQRRERWEKEEGA